MTQEEVHCIWCERKLHVFPDFVDIPYVATRNIHLCHNCIKHLIMIVRDQENRVIAREEIA